MKEEELSELTEQLMEAEHLIGTYVVSLPQQRNTAGTSARTGDGSHVGEDSGRVLELELVGTAVAVHLQDGTAAAAASGQGEHLAEAAMLADSTPRGQQISAYYPGSPAAASIIISRGGADELPAPCSAGTEVQLDATSAAELRASADSGALSLLLAESSTGKQLQSQKLSSLLAQVSAAALDGLLTAGAVARSLGLQHQNTVAALESMFAGGGSTAPPPALLTERTQFEGPPADCRAAAPAAVHAFSVEQVEEGMERLMQLLFSGRARSAGAARRLEQLQASVPIGNSAPPQATAVPPTSKQYWQARADANLPPAVVQSWGLLEQQASAQFATLQGRTANADEVGGVKLRSAAVGPQRGAGGG